MTVLLTACSGGGGGGGGGTTPTAPANLSYAQDTSIFLVGVAIEENAATFDGTPTSFSVIPPLPAGLAIDDTTGAITGTPTASIAAGSYTITASNTGGSASAVVEIEVARPPRFLLTAGGADSTISTFAVDAATGGLEHHTFAAASAGENGPEELCLHPSGRFLYVPNGTSNNISVYRLDPEGGWLAAGAPIATGVGPHEMAIHPNGNYAFVTSETSDELHVYGISQLTGELTLVGAPITTLDQPGSMAIDPTGTLLLVGNLGFPRRVTVYDVDPASGAISTSAAPFNLNGGLPVAIQFDRSGDFAFLALENYNAVIPVHVDAATKTLSLAAPGATKDQPSAISVHPAGEFIHISSLAGSSLSGFRVDRDTGALTPLIGTSTVSLPENAVFDPSGRFLYVLSRGARNVLTYAVDGATGELTLVDRIPARNSPTSLVIVQGDQPVTPVTRYTYSANEDSDDVSAFTVDPQTGLLNEIGVAALTGDSPSSVAVEPRGRFVYVANAGDGTISQFTVDVFTGSLFEIAPAVSAGTDVASLAVDPSGRFLYSAHTGADSIGVLTIDAVDGSLFQIATLVVTDNLLAPEHVAVDPTGQFLFVSAAGDGTPGTSGISTLLIDPRTGVPTRSANPGIAEGVARIAFHPKGRTLYALLEDSDEIATFDINRNTGELSEVLPRVSDGDLPSGLVVDRAGRFAYVTIEDPAGTGYVSRFPIDETTALLTPADERSFGGARPVDLSFDASGRFLFVANADSNDISTFRVDVDGALAPPATTQTGLAPSALSVSSVFQ